ncbi:MAG: PAS domain-containing protein [Deltaproteobacteria bacterium]|nr:PAS domain-containing protein [Deltaproteobacteria bacterium]
MNRQPHDLEAMLEPILRGAAVVLGCNSANLILYDAARGQVSVLVGEAADQSPIIETIEGMLGLPLRGDVFDVPETGGSLLLEAWPVREVRETSSLAEIVGTILPRELVAPVEEIIGPRRFVIVPVSHGHPSLGVMVFEKASDAPFSVQQREIMVRYSQRVGELLEIDVGDRGRPLLEQQSTTDLSVRHHLLRMALGEGAPALTLDTEFRVTSCNMATTRVLGFPPEDLLQRDVATLFRDPAEIRSILNQQFLFLSDGHHEEEIVVQRSDGGVFTAVVKALLLADGAQRAIGYLVMIHPRATRIREDTDDNLDRLIRRERLATMGELAAQLAHEIRNPLLSIGATLDSLTRDPVDPEHAATLRLMADEVKRLDLVLKDYMSLAVRCNAPVAATDLGRVLVEVARLLQPLQQERGARIILDLDGDLVVPADAEGLKQVFFNLFQNALEVSPQEGSVRVRTERGERHLSVLVEDEGPGLAEPAERLFEPFYTTKENGTGLGLTVSQRIIEAHHGTIALTTRLGGGCRATVTLPLARRR